MHTDRDKSGVVCFLIILLPRPIASDFCTIRAFLYELINRRGYDFTVLLLFAVKKCFDWVLIRFHSVYEHNILV